MDKRKLELKLKGKTCVFIDWANVHGWNKSLGKEVSPRKLYQYLRSYQEIKNIRFYFGTDTNRKSRDFIKLISKIGYQVTTKMVKYIDGRRKCDFDMEICLELHEIVDSFDSFIFFTGDGDFEPLYKFIISQRKQVIVVYARYHLGREVWNLKRGLFKTEVTRMPVLKKMSPRFP